MPKYIPEDVGASIREAFGLLYRGDEEEFMRFFNMIHDVHNKRRDQTFKLVSQLKKDDIGKYVVVDGKRSGYMTDYAKGLDHDGRNGISLVLDGKIWDFTPTSIVLVEEASKKP